MKKIMIMALLCLYIAANAQTTRFINGNWYEDGKFVKKELWIRDGLFVKPGGKADHIVDLKNGFVVPPLADAHNHVLELDTTGNGRLLRKGIFYLKNPNSIPQYTKVTKKLLNKPNTVDILYAPGGITTKGGHPHRLYTMLLGYGMYNKSWTADSLSGHAYYIADDLSSLDGIFKEVKAAEPDFLKIYVLHSEDAKKRGGLKPEFIPTIIERAHREKLRVVAHVETANDFNIAVAGGADEIAHTPGYMVSTGDEPSIYLLKGTDVKEAARRKVNVVTTMNLAKVYQLGFQKAEAQYAITQEVQKKNLRTLVDNGANVVLGTDVFNQDVTDELRYLNDLKVLSNDELLKIACVQTGTSIFPGRKIGKIENGYEASFIVLDGDPLINIESLLAPRAAVKQGIFVK